MDTNQQVPGSEPAPTSQTQNSSSNSNPSPSSGPSSVPTLSPTPSSVLKDHTLMAILAYLGILIIIPFVTESKNDPFVKFHLKQGLVLLIAEVVASVLIRVPIVGWLSPLIGLAAFVMVVIGIVNVVNKEMKELPVIGHLASKFNF